MKIPRAIKIHHLFPGLLLLTSQPLFFVPIKIYIYAFSYASIVCTIGILTKQKNLKVPYFLDGQKEDLTEHKISSMKTNKDLMFFVHGWPDSKDIWDEQVKYFSKKYHCAVVDLPHHGDHVEGLSRWGYNMEENADMIANTLKRCLEKTGKEKAILVCHDWGAIVTGLVERKFPELVSKMIVLDVECYSFKFSPQELFGMGVIYQYWLLFAWVVSVSVPFVGSYIGDHMNLIMLRIFERDTTVNPFPTKTLYRSDGRVGFPAIGNYHYFYVHIGILTGQGQRLFEKYPQDNLKCQICFIYGADKGFPFHSPEFVEILNNTPGCKVVAMKNEQRPFVGHWIMISEPVRLNKEIEEYLV